MKKKCKEHSHGAASAFVIEKSVSRHHPPTFQHCQHEIWFFTPPTPLIVRRHIEMVPMFSTNFSLVL